jgi:hypothetical protein
MVGRVTPCAPPFVAMNGAQGTARPTSDLPFVFSVTTCSLEH